MRWAVRAKARKLGGLGSVSNSEALEMGWREKKTERETRKQSNNDRQ